MRVVLVAVLALAVTPAFAQEIGSELNAVTPDSHPNTQRTDATNTTLGRTQKKKDDALTATGPQASAGKGMFGVRANLMNVNLPAPASTTGFVFFPSVPSMGFSYWLDNELAFLFDIGGALGLASGDYYWGTQLNLGIDFHFRRVTDALRPLINIEMSFVIPFMRNNSNVDPQVLLSITGHFGGGAEYFFSPNFAVGGKVVAGAGYNLSTGAVVLSTATIMTATWTF